MGRIATNALDIFSRLFPGSAVWYVLAAGCVLMILTLTGATGRVASWVELTVLRE